MYRKSGGASPSGTADGSRRGTVLLFASQSFSNLFMTNHGSGGKWWGVVTALTTITGLKRGERKGGGGGDDEIIFNWVWYNSMLTAFKKGLTARLKYAIQPIKQDICQWSVNRWWSNLSWEDPRHWGGASGVTGRVRERFTGSQEGSLLLSCHDLLSSCGTNTIEH